MFCEHWWQPWHVQSWSQWIFSLVRMPADLSSRLLGLGWVGTVCWAILGSGVMNVYNPASLEDVLAWNLCPARWAKESTSRHQRASLCQFEANFGIPRNITFKDSVRTLSSLSFSTMTCSTCTHPFTVTLAVPQVVQPKVEGFVEHLP